MIEVCTLFCDKLLKSACNDITMISLVRVDQTQNCLENVYASDRTQNNNYTLYNIICVLIKHRKQ